MTPAAITPAGRSTTKRATTTAAPRAAAPRKAAAPRTAGRTIAPPKPARIINPAGAPSVPGHRRRLRPEATPKAPRRVSGPVRARTGGLAPALPGQGGGIALPRPGRGAVLKPRSRPARSRSRSQSPSLPRRVLGAVWALPDHPLLDRVVRGRAWIAVLGVMLAGIVAMQIEVLKLGASIGRSLQRGTTLQSRNEQLRATVAGLADDQRIEGLAAGMGMVMPAPDGVGFVSVGPALVQKAIGNIHQPNTQAFMALSVPNGAVTGVSPASGTLGASAGTTGALGSTATTGATTSTGSPGAAATTPPSSVSSTLPAQTAPSSTGATSSPATIQPVTPGATGAAQTTSTATGATGASGAATLAPAQPSTPASATGGAGVPAG